MSLRHVLTVALCGALLLGALTVSADDQADRVLALRRAQEPLRDRDWAQAVERLRAFRSRHPDTPEALEAWVLQADALLRAGRAREALAATSDFLQAHGEAAWAGRMRHTAAAAYEKLAQPGKAAEVLHALVDAATAPEARATVAKLHTDLADADFEGVEVQDDLGRTVKKRDLAQALAGYRRALDIGVLPPERRRILGRLAGIHEEQGQWAPAADTWNALLAEAGHTKRPDLKTLPPAQAREVQVWLVGRGRCLLRSRRLPEARADLKAAAVVAGPAALDMEILLLRGEERLAQGSEGAFEEGVEFIRQAIREHRTLEGAVTAQQKLAEAYDARGQAEKAAAEWRALVERFPNADFVPQARDRAALALVRAGRHDEAIAEWLRFLGAHPTHPLSKTVRARIVQAAFDKGAALAARDDVDGAVAAWRAFAEAHEDDGRAPVALLQAAAALRERGDHDAALTLLKGLAGRYATTAHAPAALLQAAFILEDDLQRLDDAIAAYEDVIKQFGRAGEAAQARERLERLKRKHLQVRMDRVQGAAAAPVLRVETRNIEKLRVRVYRLGLEEYFLRKGTLSGVENLQLEIVKPDWTSEWTVDGYKAHHLMEADRALPVKELGAYVVVAGDDDLTSTTLFLRSDLEVVVKKSEGRQLLVWAFDRATHAPVEGARVLAAGDGEVGVTGKDGVWIGKGEKKGTGARGVLVLSARGAASTEIDAGSSVSTGFTSKAYVYTDRPVYRPGAEVSWRGIFMQAYSGSYAVPEKRTGRVRVFDARGQQVSESEVASTDFGTFSGTFRIDGAAPLGEWKVQLVVDQRGVWDGAFEVQEFRKPEFTIDLQPAKPVYLTGETIQAAIELSYAFGGPVADAPVRYDVWRKAKTYSASAAEDYSWYFQDDPVARGDFMPPPVPTGVAERVATGEVRTDARGRAEITFETQEQDEDAEYVVRASAMDVTRRWIVGEDRIPVTRADHMAVVKADRKVYRPKQQVIARVRTVDARERAVSRSGTLLLMRVRRTSLPPPRRGEGYPPAPPLLSDGRVVGEEEVEVQQFTLTTDAQGEAELRLALQEPGRYRLRWRSKSRGQQVTAWTDLEASGEAEDLSKHARLVPAKTLYKEGERAEVLLNSPVSRGKALLTYEGEEVLDYRFVELTSGSTLLDLPLEGRHAPNVFFRVAIPGPERLHEAQTEVVVLRHLDVAIEIDPAAALPGSEVEVRLTARDANGNPVEAELGVALVDETIYAVAADKAPPIRPYFYDKRRVNSVVSASSLGTRFYGTTRETSKDLLAEAAARTGDAKQVFARSAVRLAQEALRRGDAETAVRQGLLALQADPASWDARALLSELRLKAQQGDKNVVYALKRFATGEPQAPPAPEPSADAAWDAPDDARADSKERRRKGRMLDELAEKKSEDVEMEELDDAPAGFAIAGGAGGRFGGRGGKRPGKPGMPAPTTPATGLRMEELAKLEGSIARLQQSQNASAKGLKDAQGSFGFDDFSGFQVRKSFADTAAWRPAVRTAKDGTASLKVKLPDNLTTWRATARGVSATALVGAGRGRVVARRNLLVRIDPPRFLTQGDELTIPTAVHNNAESAVEVTVRVQAEGVVLEGQDETLSIPASSSAVSDRRFAAREPGGVRIEASAGAGLVGDAVEVKLPAHARGLKVVDARSGRSRTADGALQETFLDVPEDVIAGTNRLTVMLYPGVSDGVLDALLYLDLYPYGCVEQTVHRFLPALQARAALLAGGHLAADRIDALREAAERGAMRLRNLQHDDGSFGWFRGGGDLRMTAYALRGFVAAREAGIEGLERPIANAVGALQRLVQAGDEDARALAHLALAEAGTWHREAYATTFRRRNDDLGVSGLAYLALAAARLQRGFDGEELLRLLLERRVEDGTETHWKARTGDCFHGSDLEATGLALQALLAHKVATPHVERGMAWMLTHRVKGGFGTTKASAAFVGAAAAWMQSGRAQGFGGTIEVLLDGKVVRTVKTGARPLALADRRFTLPEGAAWTAGRHRLGFRLEGQGDLHWAVRLESVVRSEELPADTNGLSLTRRYLDPEETPLPGEPAKIKPGYSILREAMRPKIEPRDLEAVGSGDRVLVRLQVTVPRDLEYVLVEDPLPAGFEVLAATAKGPFAWEERRDDRQVFFLTKLARGSVTLEYVLQATHLGRFTALGTTAYAMYAPEVHGRGKGASVRVLTAEAARATPAEQGPTPDELYAEARRLFTEKNWEHAYKSLTALRKEQPLRDEIVEEVETLLLRAAIELERPGEIVRAREALVRRNARRIPGDLDTARAIAFAYQTVGEAEVANGLFRDLVARGFSLENGWREVLTARGREVEGLDALGEALRRYPVSNATAAAAFERARRYRELPRPEGRRQAAGRPMDEETLDALWSLTAHFAGTSMAGPAGYALVEALSRAGDLDGAATAAEAFLRRFEDSPYRDDTWYFLADTRFRRFEEGPTAESAARVRQAAEPLVTEKVLVDGRRRDWSPFRERAYHLLARVHHVLGELDQAIAMYKRASGVEDAREALSFLTEERLSLDETVMRPLVAGTEFPIRYRNVRTVAFKAYPVDLQVLFAVRKTLEGLHKIDLSGIVPAHEWSVDLPAHGDHGEHTGDVALPVEGAGAGVWLVVAKAGKHEASCLVIRSDLKVVLQRVGEKVRAYVTDPTGMAVRGAYVTVSDGRAIRARGLTDGRGVFDAPGVGSTPFVVVSKGDRYAIGR